MLAYKPSGADRFRAMVYGSYDDLKLILAHPADADPSVRGGLGQKTAFHRAQVTWQHKYSAAIEHQIDVSAGPFVFDVSVGPDVKLEVPGYEGFLRVGMARPCGRPAAADRRARHRLQLVRLLVQRPARRARSTGIPSASGPLDRPAGRRSCMTVRLSAAGRVPRGRLAARAAADAGPGRARRLPRRRQGAGPSIPASRRATSVTPTTTLKGGVGLFSQAPERVRELARARQPAPRAPARAQHYSLGVEQEIGTRD